MGIRILCVGKTKEAYIQEGIGEYLKRLSSSLPCQFDVIPSVSLTNSNTVDIVRQKEAATLLTRLQDSDYAIVLDERGTQLSSPAFATFFQKQLLQKQPVFVIGGAYGLADSVRQRANLLLSFSQFTFTHEMIRLLLVEQIYRAWTILQNKTYHY